MTENDKLAILTPAPGRTPPRRRKFKERTTNTMDGENRELLTVEQAANYLQLSQSSIRSYIRQGKLKAFRVAGKRKVLIHRDELLKLLEPARGEDE